MDPIVLAPLVLLLFLGGRSSSRRAGRRACVLKFFSIDPAAVSAAMQAAVDGGARSVDTITSDVLGSLYPVYPETQTKVTWSNPNNDQAISAELRADAICLKKKLKDAVKGALDEAGYPPYPPCGGGSEVIGGRCIYTGDGTNGGGGNVGGGGNGGASVGTPGTIVDTGVAVPPQSCQQQGFPGQVTYRVVVAEDGMSYLIQFLDWTQDAWRPIRDGSDWLEEGSTIYVSSIDAANEVGIEAINDLFATCEGGGGGGGGGLDLAPPPTTKPPGQVGVVTPGGPAALPPIDWNDVESGQGGDAGSYTDPGTVVQVRFGDRLLGTWSPENLGADADGPVYRSLVYMTLLSAGYQAAEAAGLNADEAGQFARDVAYNDANRIAYLQLIQCSPINDAIYATYGYGQLAYPSPAGRAIRMLPMHYDNKQRLTQGLPWRRNVQLGTPADNDKGNAFGIDGSQNNFPLLYLPAVNLEILWESGGTVITTEGVTWPDGSNGIMPPPALMARGVEGVPQNIMFGCLGYEVETI